MRTAVKLAVLLVPLACTQDPGTPDPTAAPKIPHVDPERGPLARGGRVPVAAGGMMFYSFGDFTFAGPTAPGSASFDGAPLVDLDSADPPAAYGGGAFDVPLDGVRYAGAAAGSLAAVFPDGAGTDYLVLGEYAVDTDAAGAELARVVYVVVPASDFAVGRTVALDGVDRVALFAAGPIERDEPEVFGAATSGSVTFTAGGIALGDAVSATVAGDFGPVAWDPGPVDPPPPGEPVNLISAGAYTMTVGGPALVYCDGSLAGREADFAAVDPAAYGLAGGVIDVAVPSPDRVVASGASLAGGFGAGTLSLDWIGDPDAPGLFVGWVDRDGAGPAGTTHVVSYLLVDGATATASLIQGGVGLDFVDRPGGGFCTVWFDAAFAAP